MVRVAHPFHPWHGREFVFIAVPRTWGEDRVFFFGDDDRQVSLPRGGTDAGDVDAFVAIADGRSALRVADLIVLAEVIDGHRGGFSKAALVGPALHNTNLFRAVEGLTFGL